MRYHAEVTREGRSWTAVFLDAPGCATCASSRRAVLLAAREALEGWLEAHLVDGRSPPQPTGRPSGVAVAVDPQLAVAVQLRWARQASGLTQAQLARRVGVSQQQVAKLERPGANPSIATLRKVADALGVRLELDLVA